MLSLSHLRLHSFPTPFSSSVPCTTHWSKALANNAISSFNARRNRAFHSPIVLPLPVSIPFFHTASLASRNAVSRQCFIAEKNVQEQRTGEIVAKRRVRVWLDPSLVEDGVCMQDIQQPLTTFEFVIFRPSYRFVSTGHSAAFQRVESIPCFSSAYLLIRNIVPPQTDLIRRYTEY